MRRPERRGRRLGALRAVWLPSSGPALRATSVHVPTPFDGRTGGIGPAQRESPKRRIRTCHPPRSPLAWPGPGSGCPFLTRSRLRRGRRGRPLRGVDYARQGRVPRRVGLNYTTWLHQALAREAGHASFAARASPIHRPFPRCRERRCTAAHPPWVCLRTVGRSLWPPSTAPKPGDASTSASATASRA